MQKEFEANIDPQSLEEEGNTQWLKEGICSTTDGKEAFSVLMPPPNVTGKLHIGHALDYTIQDILVRFHRQKGYKICWKPGTDHAGIATQMIVEKELIKQGINRIDIGRDAFIEKVWEWKEKSEKTIVSQQKKLGITPDWTKSCFTMDEIRSDHVRNVFVHLYNKGLIYRAERLVNWDTSLLTAVSDLEIENKDQTGFLYYISYKMIDSNDSIVVATTRPETLFGDTAVAVHPEDERYKKFIGKYCQLPLTSKTIPIIADEHSDPEKGSGAVKITPAHDFNDFEVGKRHNLQMVSIFDTGGRLNDQVPKDYQGLDRFVAREKAIADLTRFKLLIKEEQIVHAVPFGDRSQTILEPRLTEQWFLDCKSMAKEALKSIDDKKIKLYPQSIEKVFGHWFNNIEPWCISRQIWWGHQIPVWYVQDKVYVASSYEKALELARKDFGKDVELKQETDVLDTWFSSGIWPFTTLDEEERKTFYPTSVLVTGTDILFFWVGRMMMMSLYFQGAVPFKAVYFHGLIRDEHGKKMSKTKGNVVDPLVLIDAYGTDALRYALAVVAVPGKDASFSEDRVRKGRNFVTKLWNTARYFTKLSEDNYNATSFNAKMIKYPINRWILLELEKLISTYDKDMADYRFDYITTNIYQFSWKIFCDWYLEFSKVDEDYKGESIQVFGFILKSIIKMLSPIMPYICQGIWQRIFLLEGVLNQQCAKSFLGTIDASWQEDSNAVNFVKELIIALRTLRSDFNLSQSHQINLYIKDKNFVDTTKLFEKIYARSGRVNFYYGSGGKENFQWVFQGNNFYCDLGKDYNLSQEKERILTLLGKCNKNIERLDKKLQSDDFLQKASLDAIEKSKQYHKEELERKRKYKKIFDMISVV